MPFDIQWPKSAFYWREDDGEYSFCSIPFTWELPKVRKFIKKRGGLWRVGGPACDLMPDYFKDMSNVRSGGGRDGVLQMIAPYATRTTVGCPRSCQFCGIGRKLIEPIFTELPDWPDKPVLCDNNLLAASEGHLGRVFDRLRWWGWADFNQGLDCRKITRQIAAQINSIGKPLVRVSLDGWSVKEAWDRAIHYLIEAGVAKSRIRSYVMIGYGDSPDRDVERIQYAKNILNPASVGAMWFHELDAMNANKATMRQLAMGWTDRLRVDVMRWSYGKCKKYA